MRWQHEQRMGARCTPGLWSGTHDGLDRRQHHMDDVDHGAFGLLLRGVSARRVAGKPSHAPAIIQGKDAPSWNFMSGPHHPARRNFRQRRNSRRESHAQMRSNLARQSHPRIAARHGNLHPAFRQRRPFATAPATSKAQGKPAVFVRGGKIMSIEARVRQMLINNILPIHEIAVSCKTTVRYVRVIRSQMKRPEYYATYRRDRMRMYRAERRV